MCKHVAAALYGIGRRLDTEPELLFVLRGVNAADLIASGLSFSQGESTDTLRTDDLGALFDIDLEMDNHNLPTPAAPALPKSVPTTSKPKGGLKPSEKKSRKNTPATGETAKATTTAPFNPDRPTGAAIRKLRTLANLSPAAFAKALNISAVTLQRWEESKGTLTLRSASRHGLMVFQEALLRKLQ